MLLRMRLEARSIAEGATLEADVCIVGAGAAGITLALELAGSKLRFFDPRAGYFHAVADDNGVGFDEDSVGAGDGKTLQ